MKKVTVFFLLVVVIAGIAILAAGYILRQMRADEREKIEQLSSDAATITDEIRLAGDGWIGYSVFRSDRFRRSLEGEGIGLVYTDDSADYVDRMAKLAGGQYDIIVTTLDAYLLNAAAHDYPGVIVFVVDESKGGDGIVVTDEITTIADLAKSDTRIALTPNSPSDFFLRSVAAHFDLAPLKAKGPWRVETDGSEGALARLRAGEVQAAVLWEPQLTEAVSDAQFSKLIGTEKTTGLIVDVCIARRQFVVDEPELLESFTRLYFQSLRYFMADPSAFQQMASEDTDTTVAKATQMLDGVNFISLAQNANRWFGLGGGDFSEEQLVSSIRSNIDVLVETNLLSADPLNESHRRIINSTFLQKVLENPGGSRATAGVFGTADAPTETPALVTFRELTDDEWAALRIVGKLKVRPIYFQSSTSLLTLDGKRSIDRIVEDLSHYPSYRLLVRGHTKPEGDEQQNVILSRERAEAVANYLIRVHDVPAARIRAEGVGGSDPLPQEPDESYRRWSGRLPRVELLLVEDPTL